MHAEVTISKPELHELQEVQIEVGELPQTSGAVMIPLNEVLKCLVHAC